MRSEWHVSHFLIFGSLYLRGGSPYKAAIINSSPPGQNGRHFADDTFKCIFMNENFCILIRISQKFVHKGPIDNKSGLVKIMAWRRIGDKQLSEPMVTQLYDAYMRHGVWV